VSDNAVLFIGEELTFIHPNDVNLYNAWDNRAFELQVANHELLGHGSGKQFEEYADGTKNFDPAKVRLWMISFQLDQYS
jgi:dipeptidyl-peptidase-3